MNTSSIDLDTLFIKQISVLSLIIQLSFISPCSIKKNQIDNKRRIICIFICNKNLSRKNSRHKICKSILSFVKGQDIKETN
jgi:hypothetical protein